VLEKKLENQLKEATDEEQGLVQIGHTFDEIIRQDKDFGSLLFKIKGAYDSYL